MGRKIQVEEGERDLGLGGTAGAKGKERTLFPEDFVKLRRTGPEHFPEVGPAEAALVAAAGLAPDVLEGPTPFVCDREEGGKRDPLANASRDAKGRHMGEYRGKEKGTWDLEGRKEKGEKWR